MGVGTRWSVRSLPTLTILWFYDSMILYWSKNLNKYKTQALLPRLKQKISYRWQRLCVINYNVHWRCWTVSNSWFFWACVVPGRCSSTLRALLPSQLQAQLLLKRLKIVLGPVNDFNELFRKTRGICARGGCGGILNASVEQQQHERQNWFSPLLLSSTQLLQSMKELRRKVGSCFSILKYFQSATTKAKSRLSKLCMWTQPVFCNLAGRTSGSCLP